MSLAVVDARLEELSFKMLLEKIWVLNERLEKGSDTDGWRSYKMSSEMVTDNSDMVIFHLSDGLRSTTVAHEVQRVCVLSCRSCHLECTVRPIIVWRPCLLCCRFDSMEKSA